MTSKQQSMIRELSALLQKYQTSEWVEIADLCGISLSGAEVTASKRKLRSAETKAKQVNARNKKLARQIRKDTKGDIQDRPRDRDIESSYGRWLELIGNSRADSIPLSQPKKKAEIQIPSYKKAIRKSSL